MTNKKVSYKGFEYRVDSDINEKDVKEAMARIFPELQNAVVFNGDDEIIFTERQSEEEETSRPFFSIHSGHTASYGYRPSSALEKHYEKVAREEEVYQRFYGIYEPSTVKIDTNTIQSGSISTGHFRTLESPRRPSTSLGKVIGEYADKGNYHHLVDKFVFLIKLYEDLDVYLVEEQENKKRYVIRASDIK